MKYPFFLIGMGFLICTGSLQALDSFNLDEKSDCQARCSRPRIGGRGSTGPTGPTGSTGPTGPSGSGTVSAVFANAIATGTTSGPVNTVINIDVTDITAISSSGITPGTSSHIIFRVEDPGIYLLGYSVLVTPGIVEPDTTGIIQTQLEIFDGTTTFVGKKILPNQSVTIPLSLTNSLILHLNAGSTVRLQGLLTTSALGTVNYSQGEVFISQIQSDL